MASGVSPSGEPCKRASRRARQGTAKACADLLIRNLQITIDRQEVAIEQLALRLASRLQPADSQIHDRAECIKEALEYVANGVRAPPLATLRRNVAAHSPSSFLGDRLVSSLST